MENFSIENSSSYVFGENNLICFVASRSCTRPVSRKPAVCKKIWPREIAGLEWMWVAVNVSKGYYPVLELNFFNHLFTVVKGFVECTKVVQHMHSFISRLSFFNWKQLLFAFVWIIFIFDWQPVPALPGGVRHLLQLPQLVLQPGLCGLSCLRCALPLLLFRWLRGRQRPRSRAAQQPADRSQENDRSGRTLPPASYARITIIKFFPKAQVPYLFQKPILAKILLNPKNAAELPAEGRCPSRDAKDGDSELAQQPGLLCRRPFGRRFARSRQQRQL